MDEVVSADNFEAALKAVQRNRGAPGVDGMKTTELKGHLQKHWPRIRAKLLDGTYAVTPVKRVEIPKPNGGVRCLGIPTVLDRFIQQLLLQALEKIFDPGFSEHSYGFRPGRSAHDAVRAAREYVVRGGRDWVVDLDIEKFFDQVHHDLLMRRIGAVIRDKRVLKLIGRYLRSGVLVEGVVVEAREGTPQGGPLSPRWRTSTWTRWTRNFASWRADEVLGGATAANRVVRNLPIAKHLPGKSGGPALGAKVPGLPDHPAGADRSPGEPEASSRVRQLWDARQNLSSPGLRDQCARLVGLLGWRNGGRDLEGWIRRHIRKCLDARIAGGGVSGDSVAGDTPTVASGP